MGYLTEAQIEWLAEGHGDVFGNQIERVERIIETHTASLERWKAEALEVMAGLQELGQELRLILGTQITGPEAIKAVRELKHQVWLEGHQAGRKYAGDGWNADAHDPAQDSPYKIDAEG